MSKFKTCEEAVHWVCSRRNEVLDYEKFKTYIRLHNKLISKLKFIHVAGTNGKGSTCKFLCDCLIEEGYKVGSFTSPHLVAHQERICINHKWIADRAFLKLVNERYELWEQYGMNMFQIDFDIMTNYFYQEEVDYCVIEVGLGGRFDSTNVIKKSLISVIVSIGMDHMDRLGNTLEEIAFEKAGIIKDKGLVVTGESNNVSALVIKEVAEAMGADLIELSKIKKLGKTPLRFEYRKQKYSLNTLANYQIHNAAVAIETLTQLKDRGILKIKKESIVKGIEKSSWSGRFEIIARDPLIIVDGAHNEHGVDALLESIQELPHPRVVVFAALRDKDFTSMVAKLHAYSDKMIITTFDFYRAATLQSLNTESGLLPEREFKKAIGLALKHADKDGSIVITGSLYFISEILQAYREEPSLFLGPVRIIND